MPIAYTCPHCGKQYSVAEQYAGQSGPCASCGKTITVPLPAGMASPYAQYPPPSTGTSASTIVIIAVVGGLALLCIPGVLIALLLPAVQAAREAARRMQASNHTKQIVLAMQNYHDVFGCFPPQVVADENGNPLYSGRVLLLPYMEQQALYQQFDLAQPWDSARNLPVSQTNIPTFMDPSSPTSTPGKTDFLFVTGKGTVFEAGKKITMRDLTDGTSNTMVVVEVKNSGVGWAEPRDLDLSQPVGLPPGNHPGGHVAGFADGHVQFIPNNTPPADIRAAATIRGNETLNW
jgi:hypothetical protein